MEIFNIGIGELLVILVLMYLLLGPQGMLKAARWLGQTTRQAYRFFNENWRSISDVPMDIRDLPRALLNETGLNETMDELRQETKAIQRDINQTINSSGALAGEPPEGQPARQELKIRPVVLPPPPSAEAEPASQELPPQEPPKPKRGRPRKDEMRAPPPPKEPKKRGRPRKPPAETAPAPHLPREAPAQPGDSVEGGSTTSGGTADGGTHSDAITNFVGDSSLEAHPAPIRKERSNRNAA